MEVGDLETKHQSFKGQRVIGDLWKEWQIAKAVVIPGVFFCIQSPRFVCPSSLEESIGKLLEIEKLLGYKPQTVVE
ncbi:hypothetical protein WN943_025227 [Citrus x changshan-huyou]